MNPVLGSTALGYARTRYQAQDYLFACPCTPVFRAKVASVPSGVETYLEIAYNTVSLGTYADIKIGQTLIISSTSDHTDYLYIGRIADTPTGSVLKINESAYPLSTSYYLTVIDEYRELPRVRAGNLIDGRLAYQNLPPAIKNLRSAYVLWSSGTASLSLSPVGEAMAHGASISSYAWSIPGVTYTAGSSSSQNITITVPSDSHRWGRLTVTDSNGVSHWMVFQIYVQNPASVSLALTAVDRLRLTRNKTGHHCTVTAYKNVRTSDLIDGTRMILASRPRYSGGDPGFDPVMFVGYLVSEDNATNSANDISVTFEMSGLWERAGQLPFSPIAIRHKTSPAEWDEIAYPTAQRVIWHMLVRYSVFANLAAINFDVLDNTWFGGDRNVSSNSLGDACVQAMDEINAVFLGNPSGEMYLRREAHFLSTDDKNALDELLTLTYADMRDLSFKRAHDDPVGRTMIAFAAFFTDGSDPLLGRAKAPSVTLGTSPEIQEKNNQLLPADLTETEALEAAGERAGQLHGVANIPYILSATLRDGFASYTPSVAQWINVTLTTSLTARGRAMTALRHLLIGVSIDYERRGTHTLKWELQPEPGAASALVISSLTPDAVELDQIVVPPDPVYPGQDVPSSNTAPDTTSRGGPFDPGSGTGVGETLPSDKAREAAPASNGSRSFAIGFWVSTPVSAGFLTTLGAPYTFTVKGSALIDGFLALVSAGAPWNTQELTYIGREGDLYVYECGLIWTGYQWSFLANGTQAFYLISYQTLAGAATPSYQGAWGNTATPPDNVSSTNIAVYGLEDTRVRIKLRPVTSAKRGDAFYEYDEDSDGNTINVAYRPGIKVDGAAPTPPLFNDSHEYVFELPGTGSAFSVVYYDTNYADNSREIMSVNIAGNNAGT